MTTENIFLKYNLLLAVPEELKSYLSAQLLSEDYWNNIVTQEQFFQLEETAKDWFNLTVPVIEHFNSEIKLDDLTLEHPYVPRYYAKQGLFVIWSVDLEHSLDWLPESIAQHVPLGLDFKHERQMAKSAVPTYSEFCIMQLYIEKDYIFVGALKFPNWLNKSKKTDLRCYYRIFWKALVNSTDKTIILPTSTRMLLAHSELNNKRIPLEPYHREIMQMAGFKKQKLGEYANDLIRLPANEEVWIRVC